VSAGERARGQSCWVGQPIRGHIQRSIVVPCGERANSASVEIGDEFSHRELVAPLGRRRSRRVSRNPTSSGFKRRGTLRHLPIPMLIGTEKTRSLSRGGRRRDFNLDSLGEPRRLLAGQTPYGNSFQAVAALQGRGYLRSQYGGSPMWALSWEMNNWALVVWERPGMRTA
jgi:hypothetical protein